MKFISISEVQLSFYKDSYYLDKYKTILSKM